MGVGCRKGVITRIDWEIDMHRIIDIVATNQTVYGLSALSAVLVSVAVGGLLMFPF
jgi:hypothetical protein